SVHTFHDACWSYVDGRWLACIALSQALIERELHGVFYARGRNDLDRATYARLLKEAVDAGLDDDAFRVLDSYRKNMRNVYLHPRNAADRGLVQRSNDRELEFDELFRT